MVSDLLDPETLLSIHPDVGAMDSLAIAGTVLSVIGTVGYAAGIAEPYPGRAFSLTLLMLGVTLALISRSSPGEQ